MDGDQEQGHHGAKDQKKQGTRNCDALWEGQCQSVLGEDRPKSPDLGSFGDLDRLHSRLIIGATTTPPSPCQKSRGFHDAIVPGFP